MTWDIKGFWYLSLSIPFILFIFRIHVYEKRTDGESQDHSSKRCNRCRIRVTEDRMKKKREREMIFWFFFDTNSWFIHSWIWIYLYSLHIHISSSLSLCQVFDFILNVSGRRNLFTLHLCSYKNEHSQYEYVCVCVCVTFLSSFIRSLSPLIHYPFHILLLLLLSCKFFLLLLIYDHISLPSSLFIADILGLPFIKYTEQNVLNRERERTDFLGREKY